VRRDGGVEGTRMRWNRLTAILGLIGLSMGTAYAGWFSDERPPAGAKPLSEIIRALEDQGLGGVTEVEFDDGVWKIEVHQPDGKELDIRVDPLSGQIQSRK
jgi:hypothetical protein